MKKIIFLSIIILLFHHKSNSQDQHHIDSLQNELKKFEVFKRELRNKVSALTDSTKADILYEISKSYWGNDPEKSAGYAAQCMDLSQHIGYKKGIANAYNSTGVLSSDRGNYQLAIEYYRKAIKLQEEIGYKLGVENSYINIGSEYLSQTNYPEALKNYDHALAIGKEIGNRKGMAMCYNSIGIIYAYQGNYPEDLKYQLAALKIQEETGDKKNAAYSFSNIAIIYETQQNFQLALANNLSALELRKEISDKAGTVISHNFIGMNYYRMLKYPEALANFKAALVIAKEIEYSAGIANSYYNMGVISLAQLNYPEALKNYLTALNVYEKIENKLDAGSADGEIGKTYLKMGNLTLALQYAKKGLAMCLESGGMESIKDAYGNLAAINLNLKNYKAAYENEALFKVYNDSIYNAETEKKLTQTQMQYDFDKKEAVAKAEQEKKDAVALKELQRQKLLRNCFTVGFAIVLLFAGVFFIQRNKINNGKKRSDELLLNILPSEVAEELKSKGSAEAKQFDEVTVMFTDFKGFTQLSEKLTPAELVAEIHYCFKAFDNITTKYNIEKIKTIGDSYMCAGGLPVANRTNAADVVRAAMEIQLFMLQHLQQRKNENKEPFEIRIGIHTGPVVAGIVGVKKFAYDIWGDTVNIASRMESSGEAGKVNISGNTYDLVKNKFGCVYRGKIHAKNKGEIDMYFVENAS